MNDLKKAAQQALEFAADIARGKYKGNAEEMRDALSTALAQQEPEPQYTTGHCKERAKPNGCQLHNLHCGYPECDRKPAALAQGEQEPVAQMRGNALARWAHEQEEPPDTDWQRGYEAARRWVRQVGLPSLAQQDVPETNFGNMEPVAWTDRELELIDGMIEVQLHHAAQCDAIANRAMAERQKGWDMERVALLRKIKSISPRHEMVAATRAAIAKAEEK